ncbi:MAG: ATP-binding protein [Deltaproteobacteria bacterium]|nr:ATP-binding protein [Deltaproteobacteria bacterium]
MDPMIIGNILDSMSDCLVVIDGDGDVAYANKNTKEILGYSFEELRDKGLGLTFLVREENYDFNQVIINAVWNKTVNDYSEVDYYHPEGGMKRLAATTSYLLESNQEETRFIGFVAIFKDITEVHTLRQKEKKLLEDRDRISRDKMRSLNRLAMGVAHEIRNPVVMIGGFASRIMKGPHVDAETRSYAQNILGGAKRLESLVEEVQSCVNMPDIQLITGSMTSVFREIVKEMEPGAARKGIRIVFHNLQSQSEKSRFDPDLIKIALTNLLNNAIDFSHDGSLVDVFLYEGEHETILGVKDYGIGISEADSEFLFDPFFSTKPQGTGMGLMITERIVHEHGGKIQFDSVPGKGTLFRITIPNDAV